MVIPSTDPPVLVPAAEAGVRTLTLLEAVREALRDEMARDPSVVLLGEDIATLGGVFRATEGLLTQFGPERVIDTPMMELGIAGLAVGMAMHGLRPVAEIQFADFMHAAADHVLSDAARMRFRSNGDWTCPLVVRTAYGGGFRGGPYHSQSVEAFYSHAPGLKVAVPSFPDDAKGLLTAAIRDPDPVLFLEHKRTYRAIRGDVPEGEHLLPFGQARIVRPGQHATLIGWGWVLHEALAAADILAGEGVDVEVIDPRTLVPFDWPTVRASIGRTGRLCVVHEDTRTMGFGAEIAALAAESALDDLRAPVRRVTMPDVAGIPASGPMEDFLIPDRARIAAALRALVRVDSARRTARPPDRAPVAPASANGQTGSAYTENWADVVTRSATTVPQATSVAEIDLSRASDVCDRSRSRWEARGLSRDDLYTALFARALVAAVAQVPHINASYGAGERGIRHYQALHLGISVASPDGQTARYALIPDADTRNVLGLGLEIKRAREQGAVAPDLLQDATITLADYGAGSALFAIPLVLPGQAAAVRVGGVGERLVTRGRGFAIVPSAYLSVSVDHRALDGADAGALLGAMQGFLEAGVGEEVL